MSASTSTPTPRMRRRTKIVLAVLALLAVVFTPLAVNGLFAGALANADTNLTTIPAAIVNNDEMTTTTNADGTETVNFAGRAVVTELTGGDSGFGWTVTNSDDAQAGLADGRYYAVMTIPPGFSASINTLGSTSPEKGLIQIETDASHGYLSGIVASTVASAVQANFGSFVTAQVVNGIYTGFDTVGTSLTDAADGASQLATGADGLADGSSQLADGLGQLSTGAASAGSGASQLADGLGQLASGASAAAPGATQLADGLTRLSDGASKSADGAQQLSSGISEYTGGVSQLAGGLGALAGQTTELGQLSSGIDQYTGGVSQTASGLADLNAAAQADPTVPAYLKSGLEQISGGLTQLADGGSALSDGAAGLPALSDGIAQLSSGAQQLAAGGEPLASGAQQLADGSAQLAGGLAQTAPGATELADGVSQLASGLEQTVPGATQLADGVTQLADGVAQTVPGAEQLSDGASQLGDGAQQLSDGLSSGAEQLTGTVPTDTADAADVVAQPLAVDTTSLNNVSGVGQIVSTIMLPVALWLGALAVFLWLRPLSRAVLASSAPTARLALRTFGRAAGVAAVQAALLVAFLHLVLGVAWSSLPATLGFSLLVALAFTAFQQFLSTAFGRLGSVISLVLLALQLAATGGLYPVELLSGPFQAVNAISPLSYAVSGIQTILTGGQAGTVVTACLVMAGILVVSLVLAIAALARRRRPVEIGWVVPVVPATA
ncbi:YhgE/Pip domain-containing protein [Herbiconiux sp. KACC 21604]|uniref:YhgE/Pip domain-containing protein n=1 Tax=unclassified Herbiconiux TaxID=2618217 RepID=UPI001491CFB6|nr:YhgE/Pip domain-containing protein [Herbiconiux sp. SALV-R1]QJU54821.1 YhgE/Pip domain-containing protein [Herbiconiux sp. SALV-R1]WPO85937.1 YhgE/Pip domain-containing protein [Herbiconiux sp. KACC 21604]